MSGSDAANSGGGMILTIPETLPYGSIRDTKAWKSLKSTHDGLKTGTPSACPQYAGLMRHCGKRSTAGSASLSDSLSVGMWRCVGGVVEVVAVVVVWSVVLEY